MEDGVWNIAARILPHRFAEPPPGGGQRGGGVAALPLPEGTSIGRGTHPYLAPSLRELSANLTERVYDAGQCFPWTSDFAKSYMFPGGFSHF